MSGRRGPRVVTPEEAELWHRVMRGTKRLAQRRAVPPGDADPSPAVPASPSPAPSPSGLTSGPARGKARTSPAPAEPERDRVTEAFAASDDGMGFGARPAPPRITVHLAPSAALDHRRTPGLDKSTAGRFAKGAMDIDAVIDLHGLTQPVAHAALSRFVAGSADIGRRCLLVITGKGNGKGTGILRSEVPRWLNEPAMRQHILAFTPARPKDGGEGALYVLLKRRR